MEYYIEENTMEVSEPKNVKIDIKLDENELAVEILMKKISMDQNKLYELYRKKENIERNIRDMKKKLYYTCKHDWVRDWEDRDERSRWICTKCKMPRTAYY